MQDTWTMTDSRSNQTGHCNYDLYMNSVILKLTILYSSKCVIEFVDKENSNIAHPFPQSETKLVFVFLLYGQWSEIS